MIHLVRNTAVTMAAAVLSALGASCTYDYDALSGSADASAGATTASGAPIGSGGATASGSGGAGTGDATTGPGGGSPDGGAGPGGGPGSGGGGGTGGGGTGGGGARTGAAGVGGAGGALGDGGAGGGGPLDGLALGDHPTGQVDDRFVLSSSLVAVELFAFELTPTQAIEVHQFVVDLPGASGVASGDLSAVRLYLDAGVQGVLDGGDTEIVDPGVVDIVGSSGAITFTLSIPLALSAPQALLVVADVASLTVPDRLTLDLTPAGVVAVAAADGVSVAASGSVSSATHQVLSADLASGDVLLYLGQGTSATPLVLTCDESTSTWSEPVPAVDAGATIRWVASPALLGSEELVAVLSDDGSSSQLDLLRRATTSWAVDWTANGLEPAHANKRGFDIESESVSGDTLVVYGDATSIPKYRVRTGTTWSAEAPVRSSAGSGTVRWAELVRRPGSDEITLLYTDAADDLTAVTWSGTAWSEPTKLEDAVNTVEYLAFGGAYEALSGDLIVVWGHVVGDPFGFYWARKVAGSAAYMATVGPEAAPLLRPGVVRMAGEPGTNQIALAYVELTCGGGTCDDFIGAIWDGETNAWTQKQRIDDQVTSSYATHRGAIPVDVAWLGTSGRVVAVYPEVGNGLDWASWTSATGWDREGDFATTPALADQRVNVQALSLPGQDKAMFVVTDSNGDLFAKSITAAAGWVDVGGSLESNLSNLTSTPFAAVVAP